MSDDSTICPKCGHTRAPNALECGNCGIVFHKYHQYLERKAALERERASEHSSVGQRLAALAAGLLEPPEAARSFWSAYALLWTVFVFWGGHYIAADIQSLGLDPGFLHNVNLPFHEAGHIAFSPFGEWIGSLGGTLGQLLVPAVCGIALLHQRGDTFGSSLCLWWFGQNFLDIAPYMADARAGQLPLLGGNFGHSSPYGFHDWEFILGETGLLAYDKFFAAICLNTGRLVMVAAMAWGAWLLWRAWRDSH
jgi:hypothetical protein